MSGRPASPRSSRRTIVYASTLAVLAASGITLLLTPPGTSLPSTRSLGSLVVQVDPSGGQHVYAPYEGETPAPGTRSYANVDIVVWFDRAIGTGAPTSRWLRRYMVSYTVWMRKYSMPFEPSREPVSVAAPDTDLIEHHAANLKDGLLHHVAADVAHRSPGPPPVALSSGISGVKPVVYTGVLPRWGAVAHLAGSVLWCLVALVTVLIVSRAALVHWRRTALGRCTVCGYDLKGLSPRASCPECGHSSRITARPPDR